ncbi:TetR/AcrR family transcriptional regulator [Aeromicrobium wangtongii]|uniref:TetR/AcrR family transcriptional regulator n=1 Tax=Aeromicrobium wangtongii TaxID=2969247 RepID=A0ABY5M921_9ACTN|nr:TetR/AcrR family transcriptional regulator [Aeromicrobium wangtongii]MCD9197136.1 TetR/AcrR family transcriptional regulator [Aeromicrobium wangtongii]UUP14633.1 TetR/AcrR family transcriptional regulator [Aeromicrobium wangtongii]
MSHPARVTKSVLRTARKTTKSSRRADYSSSTKRALLDSATKLFTDHGYAGTSLDEVVAAARVTKGALYHHFPSKLALFENVFLRLQESTTAEIDKAINASKDPWERAQIGLDKFLEVCRRPQFRRICMQEGPVALGHEAWQEAEKQSTFGIVQRIVDDLLADLGGVDQLGGAFTAIFYGAVKSASEFVSDAEDPDAASEDVQATIGALLAGLRLLPTT